MSPTGPHRSMPARRALGFAMLRGGSSRVSGSAPLETHWSMLTCRALGCVMYA